MQSIHPLSQISLTLWQNLKSLLFISISDFLSHRFVIIFLILNWMFILKVYSVLITTSYGLSYSIYLISCFYELLLMISFDSSQCLYYFLSRLTIFLYIQLHSVIFRIIGPRSSKCLCV